METESENSNFSFPMGQNDHSNPYIESTTVLSDTMIIKGGVTNENNKLDRAGSKKPT